MHKGEENIGKAFKEAFDNLEIQPDTSIWNNIHQQNITLGNTAKFSFVTKIVASTILLAAVISVISYFAFNNNNQNTIVENSISNNEKITPQSKIKISSNAIIDNSIIVEENITSKKNTINNNQSEQNVVLPNNTNNNSEIITNNTNIQISEVNTTKPQETTPLKVATNNKVKETQKLVKTPSVTTVQENPINSQIELKSPLDTFRVKYSNNPIICFGEDAILLAEEGYYYNWSNGDILNKITVSPTENSTYTVTVTNSKGQTNIHEFYVEIDRSCSALFIPSAFTPNADGQNDVFKAEGHGIIKMQLLVYNKKGNLVFSTNNIDESWDGKYRGQSPTESIFFYHAIYTDAKGIEHSKKGEVLLLKN